MCFYAGNMEMNCVRFSTFTKGIDYCNDWKRLLVSCFMTRTWKIIKVTERTFIVGSETVGEFCETDRFPRVLTCKYVVENEQ